MTEIGITERGDAALNLKWQDYLIEPNHNAILITKNLQRLYDVLKKGFELGMYKPSQIIVHATATGYAQTNLEPNVPLYDFDLIQNFQILTNIADYVLRIDPIIPTDKGIEIACDTLQKCLSYDAINHIKRVRISFIDNYRHISERAEKQNREKLPIEWTSFQPPLENCKKAYTEIKRITDKYNVDLEICGEEMFRCTGCVSQKDLMAFGITLDTKDIPTGFQRKGCKCLAIKKELLDNKHPCPHNCLYCYWKD